MHGNGAVGSTWLKLWCGLFSRQAELTIHAATMQREEACRVHIATTEMTDAFQTKLMEQNEFTERLLASDTFHETSGVLVEFIAHAEQFCEDINAYKDATRHDLSNADTSETIQNMLHHRLNAINATGASQRNVLDQIKQLLARCELGLWEAALTITHP
jgi:hypothetical protein